ncbi:EamA family transporter [Massilia sp. B-10]|nr:EamA family transporter [Massilia sp. B-10]
MTPPDILMALAVVTIWGVNFVVIKIGLEDLPPVLFTALRFLFAALPLVFFVKRPQTSWPLVCAWGLFQFALQFTLLFSGMRLGLLKRPGLAGDPAAGLFTIGLAVLTLGERVQGFQLVGAPDRLRRHGAGRPPSGRPGQPDRLRAGGPG